MAMHCIRAGYIPMAVFNRSRNKTDPLVEAGATWMGSPREVAEVSDVVLSIVGFPEDVENVILSPTSGVLHGLRPGGCIIDLTTSRPELARRISHAASERNVIAFDAPVTGGDVGARNGTLRTLVGSDAGFEEFQRVEPLLGCFSSSVTFLGPAGSGQHCKMANQITIASSMVGLCEGLIYAARSGLDLQAYLTAIQDGAAGSFSMKAYSPRILSQDFSPGFKVDHFVKDLAIALDECRAMKLCLPGLGLAQQLYISLQARGGGSLGTQALIQVLQSLSGTANLLTGLPTDLSDQGQSSSKTA